MTPDKRTPIVKPSVVDTSTPSLEQPLTPAQVEWLQQQLRERQETLTETVAAMIEEAMRPLMDQLTALTTQVATMQEALAILDVAAAKIGSTIALRGASGTIICAADGGPVVDGDEYVLVARDSVGQWESFRLERGV
jgi:hypothetical protein